MTDQKEIHGKPTLLAEIESAGREIDSCFSSLPPEVLIARSSGDWRGAQTLEHLVKFVESVAFGLALPKKYIRRRWGTPGRPSGGFHDVRRWYAQALAGGMQSPEDYNPPEAPSVDSAAYRTELLGRWRTAHEKWIRNLEDWTDAELDEYCLPHPLFGSMTVRENLFYALCHIQDHLDGERGRAEEE